VKKTRVIILFGGRSAEHEISILSARNVLAALDRDRFEPVLVGIDRAGRWHQESERTLAGATGDPRALALDPSAPTVSIEQGLVAGASGQAGDVGDAGDDVVVFPVLHGTFGEDGTVQGLLELGDVAYVGAGVLGSAIGMDKDVAKRLLRDAGIPVVDFTVVTAAAFTRDPAAALAGAARLGWPLFVKPVNAGSSVGVSRVNGREGLAPAVQAALAFDRKVLIERAVDAREIECLGPRRDPRPPQRWLLFLRRQVRRSERRELEDPRRSPRVDGRAGADVGGRDLPDARAGGPGPRRFFSLAAGRRPLRQRGQYPPRVHRHLDVPEDVGGLRPVTKSAIDASCRARPAKVEGPSHHSYRKGCESRPVTNFLFSVYPRRV
jgi:D-alanine--D-alanine ligase